MHIESTLKPFAKIGFQVPAVNSDNHASNVAVFENVSKKYGNSAHASSIIGPETNNIIYLFNDSVHFKE